MVLWYGMRQERRLASTENPSVTSFCAPVPFVIVFFQFISRFGEFLDFFHVAFYFHDLKDLHNRLLIPPVLDFLLLLSMLLGNSVPPCYWFLSVLIYLSYLSL
jgi:hypothetical protein